MPKLEKLYPLVGERVAVLGCWSEVMMHMGLAEQPVEIAIVRDRYINGTEAPGFMAQVYKDGKPFSAPILPAEAGFYRDNIGYYTYPEGPAA